MKTRVGRMLLVLTVFACHIWCALPASPSFAAGDQEASSFELGQDEAALEHQDEVQEGFSEGILADEEAAFAFAEEDEQLRDLDAWGSKLSLSCSDFARACESFDRCIEDLVDCRKGKEELDRRLEVLSGQVARSSRVIDASLVELGMAERRGIVDVILGDVSLEQLEAAPSLLERVIEAERGQSEMVRGQMHECKIRHVAFVVRERGCKDECDKALDDALVLAAEIERCCAHVRQCGISLIACKVREGEGLMQDFPGEEGASSYVDYEMALQEAEGLVGAFYDELDGFAGIQGALTFGLGCEFLLDEESFVEKWGTAIDGFYHEYSRYAGAVPLEGHGRSMAKSAYIHKVDPRLCAAVSIAESGGGQKCIRPYNAWGWGAADSDPYNLASEWASFDDAIEAWHLGVASSSTGLAQARSLSSFGAIYCSSPIWAETVVDQMELIGAYA